MLCVRLLRAAFSGIDGPNLSPLFKRVDIAKSSAHADDAADADTTAHADYAADADTAAHADDAADADTAAADADGEFEIKFHQLSSPLWARLTLKL